MMMMMMTRRRSKPGERDVGASEMGVGLMQRFDSLPNFRSVIRTKNWFSYSPMFSPHVKEQHHGIPILTWERQQTRGNFLPFSPGNWNPYARPWHEHNLVALLDARQILFPSTCIWDTKRYSKRTYCFNQSLMHPSFSANPTISFKITKPKRRLPQHLGCPNIPPKLASQQLCCWRSQHLVLENHWGKCCFQNIRKMPLNDKSCWWYCTLYIFCIRLLLLHVGKPVFLWNGPQEVNFYLLTPIFCNLSSWHCGFSVSDPRSKPRCGWVKTVHDNSRVSHEISCLEAPVFQLH